MVLELQRNNKSSYCSLNDAMEQQRPSCLDSNDEMLWDKLGCAIVFYIQQCTDYCVFFFYRVKKKKINVYI